MNDYYRVSDDTVYKYNGIIREAGNLDASLMKAHELTYYPQKSSTCLGSGNCEYWYCKECDKYYSDKEAKTEIEKDSWVIKAKGHEWNEWSVKRNAFYESGKERNPSQSVWESVPELKRVRRGNVLQLSVSDFLGAARNI